jgi:chorismate-pyruvate lyase
MQVSGIAACAAEPCALTAMRSLLRSVVMLLALAGSARAETPPWQDGFDTRLAALALLQTLNADLLSHDSATLTLERWCAAHELASPARIVAERIRDASKAPTPEQRQLLGVSATEPVGYRRVRLRCGEHVLSEADNWYVPARLTPEMNRVLDTTDTSFGRAVQALQFRRRTLSADLLWSPLPQGWESGTKPPIAPGAALTIPHHVLQHRAVLTLPDGTPFSHVVETYTSEIFAFPQPRLR